MWQDITRGGQQTAAAAQLLLQSCRIHRARLLLGDCGMWLYGGENYNERKDTMLLSQASRLCW
jgi:hypothetical protein